MHSALSLNAHPQLVINLAQCVFWDAELPSKIDELGMVAQKTGQYAFDLQSNNLVRLKVNAQVGVSVTWHGIADRRPGSAEEVDQ